VILGALRAIILLLASTTSGHYHACNQNQGQYSNREPRRWSTLIRCIHETFLSSTLPPAVGFISVAGAKEFTPEMVSEEKAAVSTSAEQGVGEVWQKRGMLGQIYPLMKRGEAQLPSPNIPRHYLSSSDALASTLAFVEAYQAGYYTL
jgi:hypothetical protein